MNLDNTNEKQCAPLDYFSLHYLIYIQQNAPTNTKSLCIHDVFAFDVEALLSFILLSAAIAAATDGGRSLRFCCPPPSFSSVSSAGGEANRHSRSLSVRFC